MKLFPLIITLLVISNLVCYSQSSNTTTYFNKSYSCDSLNQNAIAVIPYNGNYLVAGIYQDNNNYSAFYVRTLNSLGNVVWEKIVDEGEGHRMMSGGGSFIPTNDGNFIMAVTKCLEVNSLGEPSVQSIALIKINKNGELIWKKNLHNAEIHSAREIEPTMDGGFVVVGYQKLEDGKMHAYIAKLDSEGEVEWDNQLRMGNKSVALSVEVTNNNDYILSGYQINEQTATDMFVSKINVHGTLLWSKNYGTSEHDTGGTVKMLPNGDCLMAGAIREQGIKKLYLTQLDNRGNIVWDKIHHFPNIANIQTSLQLTSNGGFAGVAYHDNTFGKTAPIVLFFDEKGDLISKYNIDSQSDSNTYIKDMEATSDGGYVLSGYNYSQQNSWVLKTDATGYVCEELDCQMGGNELLTNVSDNSFNKTTHFLQITPNPIVSHAAMTYQLPANQTSAFVLVYNQSGQLAQRILLDKNQGTELISAKDFDSGMYVYQLLVNNEIAVSGRFSVR
ncbi:MAG: T9SS type A sorting domain-containing protein [Chitinophagales bacterium]